MDLATLDVNSEEAKDRLAAYEAQIAEERTVEDDAIRAGYRALARGLPVISLSATIEAGGYFDSGLPRIAIVRADATTCWVDVTTWGIGAGRWRYVFTDEPHDRGRARVGIHRVSVDLPRPKVVTNQAYGASTIVPVIPPQHRPRRTRLPRFHVLWEVERWDPTPPVDPALLRHIRGDLWAVMATWDLTDLERAVLGARAT